MRLDIALRRLPALRGQRNTTWADCQQAKAAMAAASEAASNAQRDLGTLERSISRAEEFFLLHECALTADELDAQIRRLESGLPK